MNKTAFVVIVHAHIVSLTSLIHNRLASGNTCSTFAAFIDLQKAFDWVDRDLLFYKVLCGNINGKIYKEIQSIYSETVSCVRINEHTTDWFVSMSGVRQGDVLSSTRFSLFINDLAVGIKSTGIGVPFRGTILSILLYADDVVLLAESEKDPQALIDFTHDWCLKWRMKINNSKTKVIHFRNIRRPGSRFVFKYGDSTLEIVNKYKYLGVFLDEFLNFDSVASMLAESSGSALGGMISKFKNLKNTSFKTYNTLYRSGVEPIMDYGAGVWGFNDFMSTEIVQNRAMRFFFGINKYVHCTYTCLVW